MKGPVIGRTERRGRVVVFSGKAFILKSSQKHKSCPEIKVILANKTKKGLLYLVSTERFESQHKKEEVLFTCDCSFWFLGSVSCPDQIFLIIDCSFRSIFWAASFSLLFVHNNKCTAQPIQQFCEVIEDNDEWILWRAFIVQFWRVAPALQNFISANFTALLARCGTLHRRAEIVFKLETILLLPSKEQTSKGLFCSNI